MIAAVTHLYSTSVTASGDGRNGRATSEDGLLDIDLRTPIELGGTGGATNPEQLFAAGYAACFHSALKVAGRDLDLAGSAVSATVALGRKPEGGFALAVELDVELPNLERPAAEELVARAHAVCPYSNATRGNVDVVLRVG